MNQSLLSPFGNAEQRVQAAITAFKAGQGVLVLDDEDRENEGDLIFPAETIQVEQMAQLIRYGSGIVCLCITDERCQQLDRIFSHHSSSMFTKAIIYLLFSY